MSISASILNLSLNKATWSTLPCDSTLVSPWWGVRPTTLYGQDTSALSAFVAVAGPGQSASWDGPAEGALRSLVATKALGAVRAGSRARSRVCGLESPMVHQGWAMQSARAYEDSLSPLSRQVSGLPPRLPAAHGVSAIRHVSSSPMTVCPSRLLSNPPASCGSASRARVGAVDIRSVPSAVCFDYCACQSEDVGSHPSTVASKRRPVRPNRRP